jgi:type II secretory pathway pseudopilin PulG
MLKSDTRMCEELELVRKSLAPLECDKDHHEPPFGLAAATCRRVEAVRVERLHPADRRAALSADGVAQPRRAFFGWTLVDMAVAAAILIAAGMLFLPALSHSRFNAQVANCQNNLQTIGRALGDYANRNGDMYPTIHDKGKLSVAGMYAPQLVQKGHIAAQDKEKIFRCSLSAGCRDAAPLPTMEELQNATTEQLPNLLRNAGGSYGYTLGYRDARGNYHPTERLEEKGRKGRMNFPIMADAPCPRRGYQQSSNHDGVGQNVLYDDGHVRFVPTCHLNDAGSTDQDFYHNDAGQVAPGASISDAVIGGSDTRVEP